VLNPTITLREGLTPTQRPNGSGAGAKVGRDDVAHYVDYVRASSKQYATLHANGVVWDSITIGTDPLQMLAASPTTNAVALSTAQLATIYKCTVTTWNDASLGGASTDTIVPILPQVGSGTRSSFLSDIGVTEAQLGACVQTGEENDPYAIQSISATLGTNVADAIEPMSGGRLNLYKGIAGAWTNPLNGVVHPSAATGNGGYFQDPSCPSQITAPAACVGAAKVLVPSVAFVTGVPLSGALYVDNRSLYAYFRTNDIVQTGPAGCQAASPIPAGCFGEDTPFEPGTLTNTVRTIFYNPCNSGAGMTGCVTLGGTQYGPGGAPYYNTPAGQKLIADAGINAGYAYTPAGP